jgi:hypothetical protein
VLRVQERPVGVLHMSWPFDTTPLDHRAMQLLEVFTASMAVALDNSRLYDKLKRQNWQTIAVLVAAIDARDPYTRGHSEQVTTYAVGMAEVLRLPDDFVERLRSARCCTTSVRSASPTRSCSSPAGSPQQKPPGWSSMP